MSDTKQNIYDMLGLPPSHPAECTCTLCEAQVALDEKRATCDHDFGSLCYDNPFGGCYRKCVKCGQMQCNPKGCTPRGSTSARNDGSDGT
jgi:hypothetical protein